MKILVTGASGYIGNYVVNDLLSRGMDVIASSNNQEKASKCIWFHKVTYIQHDITIVAESDLFQKFNQPDVVIHLAWEGLTNFMHPSHYEITLFKHYSFLKNLIEKGAKHISVIGTCQEYGMQSGCLSEDMPSMPDTSYSLAKDTLRKFLMEINKIHSFKFQWIRLFYMYGEGQYEKAILPQLNKAIQNGDEFFNMSGGEQLRDYLHVSDIAKNIVQISLQNEVIGIINNCSGKPIKLINFVESYLKETKSNIKLNKGYYPYPQYEPMEFWGDDKKLKQIKNLNNAFKFRY
jgi:dTDP-6-deoxy-L-talose 4-dehydrogenase (NAD+)